MRRAPSSAPSRRGWFVSTFTAPRRGTSYYRACRASGSNTRQVKLPAMMTVTGPETNVACACMGLGLIQVPRYRVASELAGGALVEVLAGFPPSPLPVHVLYSHTRQLSPRLRVFIDWMAEQFRDRLSPTE